MCFVLGLVVEARDEGRFGASVIQVTQDLGGLGEERESDVSEPQESLFKAESSPLRTGSNASVDGLPIWKSAKDASG